MLRQFAARIATLIGMILLGVWSLFIIATNWIGRSTVVDDYNQLVERLPVWLQWLFTTPWWVPASLAILLTGFLIWLSWPRRHVRTLTHAQAAAEGLIPSAPGIVGAKLRLYFRKGDSVPERIADENIHRYFALRMGLVQIDTEGKQRRTDHMIALFVVFDKPITHGTMRVRFIGTSEIPNYEVKDLASRDAVIVFSDALDDITVEIETY